MFGRFCETSEKYVIVDFNAWIYEGSDNLWAGLIEQLHSTMENDFGWLRIRWFHLFDYEYPSLEDKIYFCLSYIFYISIPILVGLFFWVIFQDFDKKEYSDLSISIGYLCSGSYILSKFF